MTGTAARRSSDARDERAADRADRQPLRRAGAQVAPAGPRVARRDGQPEQAVAELGGVHAQRAAGVRPRQAPARRDERRAVPQLPAPAPERQPSRRERVERVVELEAFELHRTYANAMPSPLENRVVVMSGGSRGIGLAIAVALARAGARIALLAKTDQPHPKLPGTIHTAAEEIEAAGGEALPMVGDVREDAQVEAFVAAAAERWGGVDVVVNNASAINLAPIADLPAKRYDLMLDINVRGTFLLTRAALPHLRASDHAHVLTLSPPLSTDPRWLRGHAAYTVSKMGMSMLTLGVAEDEREHGVGANCLWPRTLIATAAVQNLLGGDKAMAMSRTPEIVADAARVILERDPRAATGNAYIDDEVLAEAGVTDLERYRAAAGELALDLFVDGWP